MLKKLFFLCFIAILFYTRFVNLGWGLPYPMHPDERNMANALQQLSCKVTSYELRVTSLRECFNPHFFAYGQFPLYLGFLLIQIYHLLIKTLGQPITFVEAVMSLRIISSIASILNVFVVIKITNLILQFMNSESRIQNSKLSRLIGTKSILNYKFLILNLFVLVFSPYFIQFSHFGTTESLLMLFYSFIIYLSLRILNSIPIKSGLNSLISGLALATKVSSIIFIFVPLVAIFLINFKFFPKKTITIFVRSLSRWLLFLSGSAIVAIIFSPHNLISFKEFIGSIRYESDVALGRYVAFYTRQFVNTVPVLFQMTKIFPYALGWPQYILAILGFFLLPLRGNLQQVAREKGIPAARRSWGYPTASRALTGMKLATESVVNYDAKLINFLRFTFLIYFLPNAFVFAKWTRFMSPILPLLSVFSILFLFYILQTFSNWINSKFKSQKSKTQFKTKKFLTFDFYLVILTSTFLFLTFISILPGLAYLSIYQRSDSRFQASDWIYKNIPENSNILSETANVVDIPISHNTYPLTPNNYYISSFNFYDLDENPELQTQLIEVIQKADYIFVQSRRIWANHTCINSEFRVQNSELNEKILNSKFNSELLILNSKLNCANLNKKYPLLNSYYNDLLSGRLGFTQVAQFSSYPKISLFNKTLVEFPDEEAEETWTVFDHPVIRIFKKNSDYQIPNSKSQVPNKSQFSNYQTTTYHLTPNTYRLLIADTPEKWEKGLMFVKNKQDIAGAGGMIFIFPDKQIRTFWNKNTLIDLDLYWLDDDKIVGKNILTSIEKTKEIVTISSPKEVNKVIEIIK